MRSLNPDHLEAFAQVAALGSFSAAAARLHLSQPAISLQIRQLERRLGVRLLERVGRHATPTPAGEEMLRHGAQIEAAIAAAIDAMAAHLTGGAGRVRLGTGATACIYLLPPMLRELRIRLPSLEIIVTTGNTPQILRAVEDNLLDAALVTLPAPGRMFAVTPIVDDPFVAIFPAGEDPPARASARMLAARPVVMFEAGARTRSLVDAWFLAAGLAPRPAMELGSVEAIKEIVGAGLGCAVLPGMAMTGSSMPGSSMPGSSMPGSSMPGSSMMGSSIAGEHPTLAVRPLAPRLKRRLGFVLRRDKPLTPGLRAMTEAMIRLGRARQTRV